MRFKKIMLISFILLVILTIGAVSANDDNSFNETLTANNVQETIDVSLDGDTSLDEMTEDDVSIEVNNIEDSSDNFVEVSFTEKDGNFIISKVEGENAPEVYKVDLSEIDGDENPYHFSVSLDDVNNYIAERYDGSDFNSFFGSGDTIRFAFEYQEDYLTFQEYTVDFDGDTILFNNDDGSQDDNWWWISDHYSINSRDGIIVQIDNLEEGSIVLTVTKFNGDSQSYEKGVDDKNEQNQIVWTLDDLDIIDELGFYNITAVYKNGDDETTLEEDSLFQLTQLNIDPCWYGQIHVLYPFDVLRIYGGEASFNVFVNGTQRDFSRENPFRWTLEDLGIDCSGEYEITVESYDEDENTLDTFEYTLNVVDDDEFMFFSNYGEIIDTTEPVLYVYCPDGFETNITIRINDDLFEDTFEITESRNWTLEDFGIGDDEGYNLIVENSDGEEIYQTGLNIQNNDDNFGVEMYWERLYTDFVDPFIFIHVPGSKSGKLEVIVDNVVRYTSKASSNSDYSWNLVTLNITDLGNHNIVVKFIDDAGNEEILLESTITLITFKNDEFRARLVNDRSDMEIFIPEGALGTITVSIFDFEGEFQEEFTYAINSSYYNKWTEFSYEDYDLIDFDVKIYIEGTFVFVERGWEMASYDFFVSEDEINPDSEIIGVNIPFNRDVANFTLNITGKYTFSKKFSDEDEYEWNGQGYHYAFYLSDLDSFDELSDKDVITVSLYSDTGKSTMSYLVQKDGTFKLIPCGIGGIPWVEFIEELFKGEEDDEIPIWNSSNNDDSVVYIIIPFDYNVTDAQITITAGDKEIFSKKVFDIENNEFDYTNGGNRYTILFGELNFTGVNDKDIINVTLTVNGKAIDSKMFILHVLDDGNFEFHEFLSDVEFDVHYGQLADPVHAMGIHDGIFICLDIPSYLNITEGIIEITDEEGNVHFSKTLSSFDNSTESYYSVSYSEYDFNEYVINANESFYNAYIPKDSNLTFSFSYGDKKSIMRGIRKDDALYKIIVAEDLADLFKITIEDKVLVDGAGSAIHISPASANRQSIYFSVGGGHFNVYVNGKKVENLGNLVRVDGEIELDLFRLTGHQDAWEDLYIYLADLNITENGVYDIRVTHVSDLDQINDNYMIYSETELYHNSNLTLTSNVKVNYQNSSVELLTGYGMNPKLMYLDTYYDSIDDVTGKITVLNSKGEEIFSSDISALPHDENGRYLSYSSFKNDNFGDNITVIYSDGNQRSGETTLTVLWRNATTDDFTPAVNNDVDDYYGNFVNLNIPDVINDGQIIVTIKFKNNHTAPISNMNVTTDFGSQAVYKFNIADIKTNYGNDFALALSDLGFYEENGDYDVDVKFTADGTNVLDVANSTVNVEFSHNILITINETSRYGISMPFASTQIFEPISVYGELYIDGKLYSHKNFEKGLIIFDSSALWAPGNHTAELKVCNSEFGTVLNSSAITFETLINTEDVEVNINDAVKEDENVFVNITVPKAAKAVIEIDGKKTVVDLENGLNTIDLGVLSHGNHTIWISYNVTLDDGNVSFYNNFLNIFVGDDGHWMNLPQPLVLEDDDTIKFNLGSDAEGYVLVIIDEKLYDNRTLVNGSVDVQITDSMFGDNKYGTHTYNITYSGDATHDSLSQTGKFDVTYLFKDDIADDGYPLRETYEVTIYLPNDANGNVTVVIDGKTYVGRAKDGKVTFGVDNLTEGEHKANISYSGDATYPPMSYENILNVSYYSVVGDVSSDNRFVSLMLPANATGNLTVYNDNRRSVLFTKALVDGKAKFDLNDLPVGIYDILAYYEGDDYDVRNFIGSFKVMPKVNITQNVIIGDNVTVTMDLNEASGSILIVVDGLTPVIREIVDGKVSYTFSTEELSFGNHTMTFQYFGTSFDSTLFYDLDEKTGRYLPIAYYWYALPKIVDPKLDSNDTTAYISVGNATGTIEIFIDGVSYAVVDIVKGIAAIDLSSFANGKYVITWKYSGDNQYASFEETSYLDIDNKVVAANMNALYTANKKYSVTVYGSDNNVMSDVEVIFLIKNKQYGKAKTNAKGVASIVIKKVPGTYTITSKALGVNVTKKLTVTHVVTLKKVTPKKSAKKLVLTATIKKVNGKYLKNKKVTFKFNGKKYTAKTNKKGVAKVTIKKSVLKKLKVGKKITYQATYLKDTVKRSVKVKK